MPPRLEALRAAVGRVSRCKRMTLDAKHVQNHPKGYPANASHLVLKMTLQLTTYDFKPV